MLTKGVKKIKYAHHIIKIGDNMNTGKEAVESCIVQGARCFNTNHIKDTQKYCQGAVYNWYTMNARRIGDKVYMECTHCGFTGVYPAPVEVFLDIDKPMLI